MKIRRIHLIHSRCTFVQKNALTMKHDQRDYGTPSGARTLDTLIKSQVLYQLS